MFETRICQASSQVARRTTETNNSSSGPRETGTCSCAVTPRNKGRPSHAHVARSGASHAQGPDTQIRPLASGSDPPKPHGLLDRLGRDRRVSKPEHAPASDKDPHRPGARKANGHAPTKSPLPRKGRGFCRGSEGAAKCRTSERTPKCPENPISFLHHMLYSRAGATHALYTLGRVGCRQLGASTVRAASWGTSAPRISDKLEPKCDTHALGVLRFGSKKEKQRKSMST